MADRGLKGISLNANIWIVIYIWTDYSLNKILNFENVIYIASKVTEICNNSALVQVMTQHWKTDKQLSEPMVIWPINVSSGLHVLIEYYFF